MCRCGLVPMVTRRLQQYSTTGTQLLQKSPTPPTCLVSNLQSCHPVLSWGPCWTNLNNKRDVNKCLPLPPAQCLSSQNNSLTMWYLSNPTEPRALTDSCRLPTIHPVLLSIVAIQVLWVARPPWELLWWVWGTSGRDPQQLVRRTNHQERS